MPKIAAGATNKNISIAPSGTGKVVVGTGAADATLQSDGEHNLILQTGNSTTGKIEIADGANGNIDITPNGTGEVDIPKVDIDGGTVDGITLGTNSAVTEAQIDNINIDGNEITSTDTNGNIDLTPNGTGEVNISKVDIDSGAIDGTTIATSDVTVGSGKALDVSAGTLTTATAQKQAIVDGADITTVGTVTSGTISTGAVIDDPTMTQGGDLTGDVYYRAASGKLTRLATGAAGTVLTSTGAESVPAFGAVPASLNVLVTAQRVSSSLSIADETATKIPFDEIYDSHSFWDETNERFLPTIAGYYFINSRIKWDRGGTNLYQIEIFHYKNGSAYSVAQYQAAAVDLIKDSTYNGPTDVIYLDGSSDYLEVFVMCTGMTATTSMDAAPYQSALSIFLVRAT